MGVANRDSFVVRSAGRMVRQATLMFVSLTFAAVAGNFGFAAPMVAALSVQEVAPGVFVHQGRVELMSPRNGGDIANCGFIVGRDAVAVVDTGGTAGIGAGLLAAVRAVTDKPIRYVINTHMHPDHVLGNAAFETSGAQFVGSRKLARALAARGERYIEANRALTGDEAFEGTRIVLPTRTIEGQEELDLGERKLTLVAHPTAHTDNDLTVLDQGSGTLFLGDLVFAQHVPALDGSLRGWIALIDRLAAREVKRVVPGHGPAQMAWPDAAGPVRRYLERIAREVRAAIKDGRTLAETAQTAGQAEREQWSLFDEFNARNVSAAFAELEWDN